VRIGLKWGCLDEFNAINREFVPLIEQQGNWKLVASYQAATGDLQEVLDVWEVSDVRDLLEAQSGIHQTPEWAALVARLKDIVVSEEAILCTKTPFSP
jgi:hypothetical protein